MLLFPQLRTGVSLNGEMEVLYTQQRYFYNTLATQRIQRRPSQWNNAAHRIQIQRHSNSRLRVSMRSKSPRGLREMPQIEDWDAVQSQSADGLLGEEASSLAWHEH
jgi:hypothetical protein